MKVSFDCATPTILEIFTDGRADDSGPKKGRNDPGVGGLEFTRNERVNTRALVPREGRLELDGFDALAACEAFRDDLVLGRSRPGGRNPPEI